jgi:hypothetical protein
MTPAPQALHAVPAAGRPAPRRSRGRAPEFDREIDGRGVGAPHRQAGSPGRRYRLDLFTSTWEVSSMQAAAIVDEAELRRLASLVARLSPAQQRVVVAVAEGFRAGWLEPGKWERYWNRSDLTDESVLGDAMTWLVRRRQAVLG